MSLNEEQDSLYIYENAFPLHKARLTLEHDPHKAYHQCVELWWKDVTDFSNAPETEWISEKQKQLAFKHDSAWILQWYPDTPVGFCRLLAYDLNALLKAAREGKGKK